jgi:hypothetical protein
MQTMTAPTIHRLMVDGQANICTGHGNLGSYLGLQYQAAHQYFNTGCRVIIAAKSIGPAKGAVVHGATSGQPDSVEPEPAAILN